MITKIALSYYLLLTIMICTGMIMVAGDIEVPKWFSACFRLLAELSPLVALATGLYWIWW
jgi:hypothetical protein